MSLVLNMGVFEHPHISVSMDKDGNKQANKDTTTSKVAKGLEDRYGVMQSFYQQYEPVIADTIADAFLDAFEAGGSVENVPLDGIKDLFYNFLTSQEVEKIGIRGLPSQRALQGWRSRMNNPLYVEKKRKNGTISLKPRPRRPSLIDTGLYMNSFVSWVDDGY